MNKAPKAPPIDFGTMSLFSDDLRGQVLRGPADSLCFLFLAFQNFRQTEVSQLDVSSLINDDVLRFKTT